MTSNTSFKSPQEQLEIIQKGLDTLINEESLIKKLEEKRPLRVKFGMDPTACDLHIGHTVVLNKLKQLQDLGHEILFLIGDFTAQIGDPTGKNVTRKTLSKEEVAKNATTYTNQVFKILDKDKTKILYNSEWLNKLSAIDMIKLAASSTVARMLERDDFSKRYKSNQPIAIHEFIYPLVQGFDSVFMKADIELGGTDQTFNLLMGRELQKQHQQAPQVVITLPLLEGLDGVKKMSKSLNNYIGIDEPFDEIFGKVMSVSDDLMWRYFDLISAKSPDEINELKQKAKMGENPRNIKIMLAKEIVERFYDKDSADKAENNFIARFQKKLIPDEIPEKSIKLESGDNTIGLANALKQAGLVTSTSDGFRMIQQGAVKIDEIKISERNFVLEKGKSYLCQVGKRRIAKVILN
jgi:tyrosyl-tRNA synthetase